VLEAGEVLRALARLPATDPPPGPEATYRLLDQQGSLVTEIAAALEARPEGEGLFEVTLAVPEVPAGRYRLAGPGGAPELSVVVAGRGRLPGPGAASWLFVRPSPGGLVPGAGADRGHGSRARAAPRREARRGYTSALELLAAGSLEAARTALAAFEDEVVRNAPYAAFEALQEAELDLAAELVAAEPRSLAPLFLLHLDVWRDDLARGNTYLAGHQQGMVRGLIDLALGGNDDGSGPAPAGRAALVSLGALLQEQGLNQSARQAFERAVALGEDDAEALLSLAFLAEGEARYGEALDWLGRLVAARPEHREGRLRLAVNRARTGDRAGAEALLRQLTEEGAGDWIGPVAASELSRLLAAADRPAEAAAVLEACRARSAEDRWLAVQFAHLLDRLGEFHRGQAILHELDPGGGPLGPSPRYLYRTPPRTARESPRAALEAEAQAGAPGLAAALRRLPRGGS
jgi:predicted Zn-dependent protease